MSDSKKVTIVLPDYYKDKLDAIKKTKKLALSEQVRRSLDYYWDSQEHEKELIEGQ